MRQIIWRPEAEADFKAILEYIAERNIQSAFHLYEKIDFLVSQLAQRPYMYRRGRVSGTRELVAHPNYIVVYRIRQTAIDIISILHSRQRYP